MSLLRIDFSAIEALMKTFDIELYNIPMQKQTRKSCGRLRVMTFPRCGRSAKENVLSTEGKADI